jgi:hypothetical protein
MQSRINIIWPLASGEKKYVTLIVPVPSGTASPTQ